MIEKIKEKWDEILLHIKEEHELTDVSFKTWLLPTQPYSMKDGTLQILVPDVQFLGYIKTVSYTHLTLPTTSRV